MSDDDHCPSRHQVFQRFHDCCRRSGVKPGEGFIQNDDRRITHDRSGDGNPLALPAGQRRSPLTEHRVVNFRELPDELVRVRRLRRCLDFLQVGGGASVSDVLGDAGLQQNRLLEHHADLRA